MSNSSYCDNASAIDSFSMIPKEYEQYNAQEQYNVQRQYLAQERNEMIAQQQFQMRNPSYGFNFPYEQHQVGNQNNFPMVSKSFVIFD